MDKKDVESSRIPKPENKKLSRRQFLKMAGPAVAGFALDRVVFKGFFSDLLWGFITNPQVRDKVMNKLQNLDEAVKEVQQQVEDRRTIKEKVELGEKMNVSEDWMRPFPKIEVYSLEDNEMLKDKTVFFADLPKIAVQVAHSEKKGGITRYSEPNEFLEESSVILPGLQVGSRTASNAYIPSYYTVIRNGDGNTLEFFDVRDNTNNPRDGALVLGLDGRMKFVSREQVRNYTVEGSAFFDSSKDKVQGVLTVPSSIEVDLTLPPDQFLGQIGEQMQKIDKNVLFSQNLSNSKRYETFYLQADDDLILMGICRTNKSGSWAFDQRLSINQAVNLALEYAQRNNYRRMALIPTDPDINDGVFQVRKDQEWKKRSLTHGGEKDLLRQPFYLSIKE